MQNAKCKKGYMIFSTSEHLGNHWCPWASQIQAATPAAIKKQSRILKRNTIPCIVYLKEKAFGNNTFFYYGFKDMIRTTFTLHLLLPRTPYCVQSAVFIDGEKPCCETCQYLFKLFICLNGILNFQPEFNDFRPGPLFPVQQQVGWEETWVGHRGSPRVTLCWVGKPA